MKFKIAAVFLALLAFECSSYGFSNPFGQKKEEEPKNPPMVHTVEEWMETATNVKMDIRKRPETKIDDSIIIPPREIPQYLTRYNLRAGSKELDLSTIIRNKTARSPFIAEPNFNWALYSESYFYPQSDQVASTLYYIETDSHLSKQEKLSDLNIFEHTRYPLISTALPALKDNFFSTLTVVDISSDGKKIIVKEKRGSRKYGLYETYVWVYFITNEAKENNECYLNNLDFTKAKSSMNEIINNTKQEDEFLYPEENDYSYNDFNNRYLTDGVDLGNLKEVPKTDPSFRNVKDEEGNSYDAGELKFTNNRESKFPELDLNAKLNYKDVKSYIKGMWKYDEFNSGLTTRWYNNNPDEYKFNEEWVNEKKNIGFGVRLNLLNETIKAYWFDRQHLFLNHTRWDLNPLGFNRNNNSEVVVLAYTWTKDGRKVSLGRWAVDINTGTPRLIDEYEDVSIEANAFCLKSTLNPN